MLFKNKEKKIQEMTKEQKNMINLAVLNRYHVNDEVTIRSGKYKDIKGIIKLLSYTGGDEWAIVEVYDPKKGKTFNCIAPEICETIVDKGLMSHGEGHK